MEPIEITGTFIRIALSISSTCIPFEDLGNAQSSQRLFTISEKAPAFRRERRRSLPDPLLRSAITRAANAESKNQELRLEDAKNRKELKKELFDAFNHGARLTDCCCDIEMGAFGDMPLHYAVRKKNGSATGVLIDQGAPINMPNAHGETPLAIAVKLNDLSIVRRLIFAGASVRVSNLRGETPLHHAAKKGYTDILDALLKTNDAQPSRQNKAGNTPLHCAIGPDEFHRSVICLLLKYKANPNVRNKVGSTPFHQAIMFTSHTIVSLMLQYGADPNLPDGDGILPIDLPCPVSDAPDLKKIFQELQKTQSKK